MSPSIKLKYKKLLKNSITKNSTNMVIMMLDKIKKLSSNTYSFSIHVISVSGLYKALNINNLQEISNNISTLVFH